MRYLVGRRRERQGSLAPGAARGTRAGGRPRRAARYNRYSFISSGCEANSSYLFMPRAPARARDRHRPCWGADTVITEHSDRRLAERLAATLLRYIGIIAFQETHLVMEGGHSWGQVPNVAFTRRGKTCNNLDA